MTAESQLGQAVYAMEILEKIKEALTCVLDYQAKVVKISDGTADNRCRRCQKRGFCTASGRSGTG